METLRQCKDLPRRVEQELSFLGRKVITQQASQMVLSRILKALGSNFTGAANLFVIPDPNGIGLEDYLKLVDRRLAEFQEVEVGDLEQFEAEAFKAEPAVEDDYQEVPIETDISMMMNQMKEWQQKTGTTSAEKVAEAEEPKSNAISSAVPAVAPPASRNDTDSESSSSDSDSDSDDSSDSEGDSKDTGVASRNPEELCQQLLSDRLKLSQFTKDKYELVNPNRETKIGLGQIQVLLDHLLDKGFSPDRLRSIVADLLKVEFRSIRSFNYVHFSIFLRHVIQRYLPE